VEGVHSNEVRACLCTFVNEACKRCSTDDFLGGSASASTTGTVTMDVMDLLLADNVGVVCALAEATLSPKVVRKIKAKYFNEITTDINQVGREQVDSGHPWHTFRGSMNKILTAEIEKSKQAVKHSKGRTKEYLLMEDVDKRPEVLLTAAILGADTFSAMVTYFKDGKEKECRGGASSSSLRSSASKKKSGDSPPLLFSDELIPEILLNSMTKEYFTTFIDLLIEYIAQVTQTLKSVPQGEENGTAGGNAVEMGNALSEKIWAPVLSRYEIQTWIQSVTCPVSVIEFYFYVRPSLHSWMQYMQRVRGGSAEPSSWERAITWIDAAYSGRRLEIETYLSIVSSYRDLGAVISYFKGRDEKVPLTPSLLTALFDLIDSSKADSESRIYDWIVYLFRDLNYVVEDLRRVLQTRLPRREDVLTRLSTSTPAWSHNLMSASVTDAGLLALAGTLNHESVNESGQERSIPLIDAYDILAFIGSPNLSDIQRVMSIAVPFEFNITKLVVDVNNPGPCIQLLFFQKEYKKLRDLLLSLSVTYAACIALVDAVTEAVNQSIKFSGLDDYLQPSVCLCVNALYISLSNGEGFVWVLLEWVTLLSTFLVDVDQECGENARLAGILGLKVNALASCIAPEPSPSTAFLQSLYELHLLQGFSATTFDKLCAYHNPLADSRSSQEFAIVRRLFYTVVSVEVKLTRKFELLHQLLQICARYRHLSSGDGQQTVVTLIQLCLCAFRREDRATDGASSPGSYNYYSSPCWFSVGHLNWSDVSRIRQMCAPYWTGVADDRKYYENAKIVDSKENYGIKVAVSSLKVFKGIISKHKYILAKALAAPLLSLFASVPLEGGLLHTLWAEVLKALYRDKPGQVKPFLPLTFLSKEIAFGVGEISQFREAAREAALLLREREFHIVVEQLVRREWKSKTRCDDNGTTSLAVSSYYLLVALDHYALGINIDGRHVANRIEYLHNCSVFALVQILLEALCRNPESITKAIKALPVLHRIIIHPADTPVGIFRSCEPLLPFWTEYVKHDAEEICTAIAAVMERMSSHLITNRVTASLKAEFRKYMLVFKMIVSNAVDKYSTSGDRRWTGLVNNIRKTLKSKRHLLETLRDL